ncbi:MAG: SprT family zinc-dependent metalloprotease [Sulfitobacter sp.]|uniref:M48 family metallopeptidase n=1 Tax=Alphaproteobacteria TaxID=28211 RepID=UPI003267B45F
MNTEISEIGGINVEIVRKQIKNLHIGCYPPQGRVRVAAPEHVSADAIRLAVLRRMPWIRRRQAQFIAQQRQTPRRYISGETHFLFGRAMRLEVREWDRKSHRITRQANDRLRMEVPVGSHLEMLRQWMNAWLKKELRKFVATRIETWSAQMGVRPQKWGIRPMKTKWGSCNPSRGIIWLNSELAKKPERMIDYVIVHELGHFISAKHDERFTAVLDREIPRWRTIRRELNSLPLSAWTD